MPSSSIDHRRMMRDADEYETKLSNEARRRSQAAAAKLGLIRPGTSERITIAKGTWVRAESVSPSGTKYLVSLPSGCGGDIAEDSYLDNKPSNCYLTDTYEYLDGKHVAGGTTKLTVPTPVAEVYLVKNSLRGQQVFHPGRNELQVITALSSRKANPWLMLSDGQKLTFITLHELADWTMGNKTLIEAYLGTGKMSQYRTGVLLRNITTGVYALTEPEYGQVYHVSGALVGQVSVGGQNWVVAGTNQKLEDLEPGALAGQNKDLHKAAAQAKKALEVPGAKSGTINTVSMSLATVSAGTSVPLGMALASGAGLLAEVGLAAIVLAAPGYFLARHLTGRSVLRNGPAVVKPKILKAKKSKVVDGDVTSGPKTVSNADELLVIVNGAKGTLGAQESQMLTQVLELGTYVLSNLHRLPTEVAEGARELLLDHLPTSVRLHTEAVQHSRSASAMSAAHDRLTQQLHLIAIEAQGLSGQIETRVADEQDKHGRFLDSKLRRSDLD